MKKLLIVLSLVCTSCDNSVQDGRQDYQFSMLVQTVAILNKRIETLEKRNRIRVPETQKIRFSGVD